MLLAAAACPSKRAPRLPLVAVVDDGERIGKDDGERPILQGEGNGIWGPGRPARIFGLPGETVAFQVVVRAAAPLSAVTVDLPFLAGPVRIENSAGAQRFQPIERFVVAELALARRSGGRSAGESLGWQRGAAPREPRAPGTVPDPLIPIALAPPWADYPMTLATGEHRVIFIDVTLPDTGIPPGLYRGVIRVRARDLDLAQIELQLQVGPVPLPYAAVRTLVYYDPQEIRGVTGSDEAVRHYLQLMHRHHLSTIYRVDRAEDVLAQREELSGRLFTAEGGYEGPGQGRGPGVIALGSYGTLGMPDAPRLRQVEQAVRTLLDTGALAGGPDLFLYAVDERCDDPAGPAWRAALSRSEEPVVRNILVGHTCSQDPAEQPVDLAILHAAAYDPAQAARARSRGKRVWIYNGSRPHSGSFLTDGGALSLRANGWIQALYAIERWFYWESTFWNDDNRGGRGPYDPLVTAETFHNQHGDFANGDGVLVYPGRQVAPSRRSLGFSGVLPSFRLKQWRRGISDAGYLLLCRRAGPAWAAAAEREARTLVGPSLSSAHRGPRDDGAAYLAARRRLFDLIVQAAQSGG